MEIDIINTISNTLKSIKSVSIDCAGQLEIVFGDDAMCKSEFKSGTFTRDLFELIKWHLENEY